MPAVTPVIGATRAEAQALQAELDSLIPESIAISKLEALLGNIDLSGADRDAPLPPLPSSALAGQNSTRDRVLELAEREKLPITELARRVAAGRTGRTIVGTAEDVADELQSWVEEGGADGFVISPPVLPMGLDAFVDGVVPILQARGAFRTAYEGATLRENLGLQRPSNMYESDPALIEKPEIW
jgi:alkanesulfonate monooxygenase SsuD/methylene tetrahydromethanopterin reductase-like flavin-dependent oxidoreductase (luciferase family)